VYRSPWYGCCHDLAAAEYISDGCHFQASGWQTWFLVDFPSSYIQIEPGGTQIESGGV